MRTIKFRHWYKGKLLKGVFIDGDGCIYPSKDESRGNWVDYDFDIECSLIVTEQFTGLQDKNGVDIYEGDILLDIDYKYKVEYIGGWFVGQPDPSNELSGYASFENFNSIEVIGNIH